MMPELRQAADIGVLLVMRDSVPTVGELLAHEAYGSDMIGRGLFGGRIRPVISTDNPKITHLFDGRRLRGRNANERRACRFKDNYLASFRFGGSRLLLDALSLRP